MPCENYLLTDYSFQIFNKSRKFYFGSYKEVIHAMKLKSSLFPDGQISCQFLHFAKTEDIWLKSASKVERGASSTQERRGGNVGCSTYKELKYALYMA